jgi:hypothetical protein
MLKGIANHLDADFDVEVTCADGRVRRFPLWLGEKGRTGALMDVKNTSVTYVIPAELASTWIGLLEPYAVRLDGE